MRSQTEFGNEAFQDPIAMIVVKVGGSLFDLPDLGSRLAAWLRSLKNPDVLLVPGGGVSADAVRTLDRVHGLGEECSHWLSLEVLALNARFLGHVLDGGVVVDDLPGAGKSWRLRKLPVLNAYLFACADERQAGRLPHCWEVTSDSVAARVAAVSGARRLILLKSIALPVGMSWDAAACAGLVDVYFPRALAALASATASDCSVEVVNLREWKQ